MNLIKERQDALIQDFATLGGEKELILDYLIDLGERLAEFPDDERKEENLVKGCQSKVWIVTTLKEGNVFYQADSNTVITKGLVSLLVRVLDRSTPEDIVSSEIFFIEQIGMDRFIGTQRSNGFSMMIKQMKWDALALSAKTKEQ